MYLQRRVFRTFERLLRKFGQAGLRGRVLDLGGFRGGFANVCRDLGCEEAVPLGIEQGVDFETDRIPYPDGHFDIACATSLIEHLHDPTNMLSEAYRVLRPGGHFVLVTPHWPYCWREFYGAYTHIQPYTHCSIRAALESHGFEVLATVPWMAGKSDFWWDLPAPWSFRLAALLPFTGLDERRWIPGWFKGRSRTLLALARRPR